MAQAEAGAGHPAPAALERRLWLACAPPLTRVPEVGDLTYYLPRGYAHQCDGAAPTATGQTAVEKFLCAVTSVDLLVRGDDVYANIGLAPVDRACLLLDPKDPIDYSHDKDAVAVRDHAGRALKAAVDLRDKDVDDVIDHGRRDVEVVAVRYHGRRDKNVADVRELLKGPIDVHEQDRGDNDAVDVHDDARRALKGSVDLREKDAVGHARRALKGAVDDVLDHGRRDMDVVAVRDRGRRNKDITDVRDPKQAIDVGEQARRDKDAVGVHDHAGRASNGSCSVGVLFPSHAPRHPKTCVDLVVQPEQAATEDSGLDVLLIFPKLLTEREVAKGRSGAFHVSKACATAIFPPLHDNPMQTLRMVDLGGRAFMFNHAHSGLPGGRRTHLLTSGWNNFVNTKQPIKGDLLMFIRLGQNLRIALQRAATPAPFVCGNDVAEATRLAAEGMAFTVSWCPRRGAEFVLPCKEVDDACRREWKLGMRVTCDTGVVRPGVVHEELPHRLMSKQGTVRVINEYLWQKLDIEWDVQRPSSSGSTARSAVVSHSLRLFGVDIVP